MSKCVFKEIDNGFDMCEKKKFINNDYVVSAPISF